MAKQVYYPSAATIRFTEATCEYCGKKIPLIRHRDRFKHFCNRSCAGRGLNGGPLTPCVNCGALFHKNAHRSKLCSWSCMHIASRSTYIKNCERCNKPFVLKNRAYERRGKGRFCSTSCATRIYSLNENYFDNIDTEQKAYWLGFTDGDGYQDGDELIFNLNPKDELHILKFKAAINSNRPIKHTARDGVQIVTLRVGSKRMCRALNMLYCFKAKTFTVLYPPISPRLDRHFIRGVFDADGCLYISKKGHRRWSLYSASLTFLLAIKARLEGAGIHVNNPRSQKGRNLSVSRREDIKKLHSYLYDGASVFLSRKEVKFI